jgi:uncharacterized RDD family membrane protein YckC
MDTLPSSDRGGFWRRLVAFAVDAVIVAVGLQLLGIPVYALSGGHVQSNVLQLAFCQRASAIPDGVEIPSDFGENYVYDCVNRFFGLPTGRWVQIGHRPQPQPGQDTIVILQVDAAGHTIDGFSFELANLLLPVLLIYRIGLEWRNGQTIGKRLTRLRVVEIRPSTSAVTPAARRNLALFLPFLLWPACALVEAPLWYWFIVAGILLATIAVQIAYRCDTYYDRAAGTAVIGVQPDLPPLALRSPAA